MVDFQTKGTTFTGTYTYYASLLKKSRKSIKTERRGMLARGVLTPTLQFSSSQLVCCSDRGSVLRL